MNISINRLVTSATLAFSVALFVPIASAQDAEEGEATDERVLDTVEVRGVQNDAAMAAFQAGDYETAEVEFIDNARCALRRERNLIASAENARIGSDRAEVFANTATANTGATSGGTNEGGPSSTPTGLADASRNSAQNTETRQDRTCEKRGRQLYFAGLSQLQLGKTNEALRSFERATAASKILYDAHYKIGLIKLLTGDERAAKRELNKVEGILKRCRDCEARQEIVDRRDHLTKALAGEVSLQ